MGKYLDIKIGKSLKLYRLATGIRQSDGKRWGLFSYTPFEKTDKGDYIYGQEYTIFMDNLPDNMVLKDGDMVEVANILSVSAEDNTYTGKDKVQHTKRVIKVVIDIKLKDNNNNNYTNNNYQNNQIGNDNNEGAISDGSYDLPDF